MKYIIVSFKTTLMVLRQIAPETVIKTREKKIFHCWHAAAGTRSSPYLAKKAELEATLKWLKSEKSWNKAVIVCDCKSLVKATCNSHQNDSIIVSLQQSVAKLIRSNNLLIVWVPNTVTFGAMSWWMQKPSGDPLQSNLLSCT